MSDIDRLFARLDRLPGCPVCGAEREDRFRPAIFACGAIFAVHALAIKATRACSQRSRIAAELLTKEAFGVADTGKTLADPRDKPEDDGAHEAEDDGAGFADA